LPAALVNDQLRDYWGKAAIRAWAERDIVGERLTIAVTEVVKHYDNFIVTADIDGNLIGAGCRTRSSWPFISQSTAISSSN